MALFSLIVDCVGIGSHVTQCRASSAYEALREYLSWPTLNQFLSSHPDWPRDFKLRDVYLFIPLDGLKNIYSCGLGQKGKYIEIHIVQTVQKSIFAERHCGPQIKDVTLR